MKEDELKRCLTMYGEIKLTQDKWWELYEYVKNLIQELGLIPNYIGVQSKTFKSGKILTIYRNENKLKKALDSGDDLNSLEVMSLPQNFKQAAFDYDASILIYKDFEPHHITIAVRDKDRFNKLNIDKVVDKLKSYLKFTSGQIYELSISEDPLIYSIKGKPVSNVKGLNIIKEFKS
ncbi:hypothetical protein ABCY62_00170 [Acetivibrio clariflavus]|uniref:hypothetical protein n=1 Tax=Acetivibrio clariflavus TaxID=288965 RepID=UPI0031F5D363